MTCGQCRQDGEQMGAVQGRRKESEALDSGNYDKKHFMWVSIQETKINMLVRSRVWDQTLKVTKAKLSLNPTAPFYQD